MQNMFELLFLSPPWRKLVPSNSKDVATEILQRMQLSWALDWRLSASTMAEKFEALVAKNLPPLLPRLGLHLVTLWCDFSLFRFKSKLFVPTPPIPGPTATWRGHQGDQPGHDRQDQGEQRPEETDGGEKRGHAGQAETQFFFLPLNKSNPTIDIYWNKNLNGSILILVTVIAF